MVVDIVVTADLEVPASTQYRCGDELECKLRRRWDWPMDPSRKACSPPVTTILGSPEGRET